MASKMHGPAVYITQAENPREFIGDIKETLIKGKFETHAKGAAFTGKSAEEAKNILLGFVRHFEKEHILIANEIYEVQKDRKIYAAILKVREIAGYEIREIGEGQRIAAIKLDFPHFIVLLQKEGCVECVLFINKKDKNVEALKKAWELILNKGAATTKEEKLFVEKLQALGKGRLVVSSRHILTPNSFLTKLGS